MTKYAFFDPDGTRNEKQEVIAHAIEQLGISSISDAVMIGDRANDVLGARDCKMSCIGVLWGFGSAEELLRASAAALCQSPKDLPALLQK